jgi:hypothetical protein
MANTTNYNWETPDDTDLVKDGALAIRTLGSSIDTTTKALNPSTTLGDIEYRSATANTNTRLGIGTTGQVLTVSGGVPTWASAAGGGKVLQVVSTSFGTSTSTTSTTYTDATDATLSITPSSATSKVLFIGTINGEHERAGDFGALDLRIVRGSTAIWTCEAFIFKNLGSNSQNFAFAVNSTPLYLDSPATTSATTYKIQFKQGIGAGTCYINRRSGFSTITLMEIGA